MKTYGVLQFEPGLLNWRVVDLSPHVAIALKRLFPRIPQTATVIHLSDTDEIRADLHWFMLRYPLAVSDADRDVLIQGVERTATRAAERDRILMPDWRPSGGGGFRQGKAPFLYQSQAARIAIANPNLLVGDDAGLGKTISAATMFTDGAPLPAAVVCDAHLCKQWQSKLHEFTYLVAHVVKTRAPYSLPKADVYIFSYAKLTGWADLIDKGVFPTVVWDEIQELRHGDDTTKGKVSALLARRAKMRVGLTATPIYNYGNEMHQIMGFVKSNLLGDCQEFTREWCGNGKTVKDPDALGAFLRETGYFLRRTEDDPVVDLAWGQILPPLNTLDFEVEYDDGAVKEEQALARMLAIQVRRGSFVEAGKAARDLDIKMRQITGIAKARSVAAYVKMLLQDSERVVIAGWHREVYAIWQKELERYAPVLYTGSETAAGKERAISEFTHGKSRVMLMSLRSGKGIDGLQQFCNEAVVGELDWSPQVHYQFFRRFRRPGMDPLKPVTGHYLHTDYGSDPVLLETLGIKADQSRGINDPGSVPTKFSDDSRIKRLAQYVIDHGG